MASFLSEQTMRETSVWATYFATDWRQDVPDRIHLAQIGEDGNPMWHPDFERWLTGDRLYRRKNDEQRLRTTRVMRRLRRAAVREYETLYRILVLGERVEDTTRWLNERAQRNAVPYPEHRPTGPHYTQKDCLALVVAGIDYAREYW